VERRKVRNSQEKKPHSSTWDIGPCTLSFPLVNDLLDVGVIKIWAQKFIANDLLDFGVIKANNMFLQGILVHVCGNRSVGDRRDRFWKHLGPAFDVLFVDIFQIIKKLVDHVKPARSTRGKGSIDTLNTVLSMRLKNSKVVPKKLETICPVLTNVLLESST